MVPPSLLSNMDILFTLRHFFTAKYRNGFGVHSPNIFEFFTKVIFSKEDFDYSQAELSLVRFKSSSQKIMVTSAGAKGDGSKCERSVRDIAKSSSSYGKYGQLLQRIAAYLKPNWILELGTSLGIGTIYMASGSPSSNIITVEACPETAKVASDNFKLLELDNITSIHGDFDVVLEDILSNNDPFGLIYVDGNHTYEATKRYFEMIAANSDENTVVIFDDINWSRGMAKAWDEIKSDPKTVVAIETMRMGIVFFNTKLTQKIYCTRF